MIRWMGLRGGEAGKVEFESSLSMLHCAQMPARGGKRPFAAVSTDGGCADSVAVRCGCIIHRLKIWCSVNHGGKCAFAAGAS